MKKTIKIIALCLSIVALTALFAGCNALDEMKANHAILSEDRETISFNSETYKKLPEDASLYYTSYYNEKFGNIAVTDEGVPVLLSEMYTHSCQYDETRDIFVVALTEDCNGEFYYSYINDLSDGMFYCNEKDYDKYIDAIEKGELDRIGFEYEIQDEDYNYHYVLEAASQEVSDEILGHITNPEKMTSELFGEISGAYNTECLQGFMYKCDADGVLSEPLDGYDIYRVENGDAYFLNFTTETAVKLSDKTTKALKDVYFYGDYEYDYDDIYTEDDAYIGIIGSDDGEEIVIGDVEVFGVDF